MEPLQETLELSAPNDDAVGCLAAQLAQAYRRHDLIDAPCISLGTPSQAYAVQQALLAQLGWPVHAWKVGAKSPEGPIQGAPLPTRGVLPSGADLRRGTFSSLALELEVAFRLRRGFAARERPYAASDVLPEVGSMLACIEIVASRFRHWPEVDKLAQLADLQNHGALIIGEEVHYDPVFDVISPALSFTINGQALASVPPRGRNPAGDPRRLLPWVVNHHTQHGCDLEPGMLITTGSCIGLNSPAAIAGTLHVKGRIEGLPPVELRLHDAAEDQAG